MCEKHLNLCQKRISATPDIVTHSHTSAERFGTVGMIIGAKHTAFEHVTAGIPKHFHGNAKSAAERLIKQEFILAKLSSYGLQISLNPERIDEMIEMIED